MFIDSIPRQLHVSNSNIKPHNLLDLIKNNFRYPKTDSTCPNVVFKPDSNQCLWTSSWLNQPDFSDWIKWCKIEKFESSVRQGFLLDPQKDARIFEIDSIDDYISLRDNYTTIFSEINLADEMFKTLQLRVVDFELMSLDIDAIHLTKNGQYETHLPLLTVGGNKNLANRLGFDTTALYGWDCESTLWLNPKYENIEYIGEIHVSFEDWNL